MNSYRKIFALLLCLVPNLLVAQEICGDGIDNDNNGFVDCYDSACSGDEFCDDFYFGNSVLCQDPATQNPAFEIKLQWGSDDLTAFNSVTPAIGDIDGDGTPEVVTTNRYLNTVTVLNGANGNTEHGPLDVGFDIAKTVAIANLNISAEEALATGIDADCATIFVRGFKNGNLRAYNCSLDSVLWSIPNTNTGNKVGLISLADFNGDGIVELLHGNEIRNANTGGVIIAGLGDFQDDVIHGTVAIDILPDAACANCEGLEIVAGGKIYSVDIPDQTDRTVDPVGTRTLERDINDVLPPGSEFAIKNGWGWNFNTASIADYNQDGNIDVIISGGQYVSGSIRTAAVFWDVINFNVITFLPPQNHSAGTGRINIADIDGDGQLNCTFVSKQRLYALDENMVPLTTWNGGLGYKDINEGSSGFTGCTVFDFNDDKAAEVIYRGETYVHIIDGTTGNSLKQIKCTSRTFEEYPVVADVDGDGASEICVSCSFDDNTSFTPYSNGRYGHIRVFEADGGENWQPSRPIWNQHGYFNVNINDDLTIPTNQQDPGKVFSTNVCTTGDNRPLNAFLNQAPYLNETGCPSYISPDIDLIEITSVGQAQCPEGEFNVTIRIENTGDTDLTGTMPITFYNGAPDLATSTKLNTVTENFSNFAVGDTLFITKTVVGQGGNFDLYVSINDAGAQNPPVTDFVRPVPECDDTNNLDFIGVTSTNFDLQHEVISHNIKCDPTKPDNGDAKVFYFGTVSETITNLWNENFDNLTPGDEVDNGSTSWSFTTAPSGADNLEVSFTGVTNELFFADVDGTAVWESETIDISSYQSAKVSVGMRSSAKNDTFNDFMRLYAVVDGSEQALSNGIQSGNFGSLTATLEGITGNSISIRAKVKNGRNDEFYYLDDLVIQGVTDALSGEITAGFDFHWFQNNNFNDTIFTGNRYTALAEGNYQVIASSQTNSCTSNVEDITIQLVSNNPVVGITKTQDLLNCDTPDGILDAYVIEGGSQVTTGYDFTWYLGNDFTTVVAVGPTAINLEARTYSVVVTDETSGCETTLSETVDTDQTPPGIFEVSTTHITDCTDPNSGEIIAGSDGANSQYTFNWYDGTQVKATPDFSASGNNGMGVSGQRYHNLEAGFYTVEVQHKQTGCISAPLTIEILDNSNSPAVTLTLSDNTSCTTNGNGSASAEIAGQSITDYTFTYYSGSNALAENEISTVSGTQNEVAQLLSAGNYLVTVEEIATGCVGREYFTIEETLVFPSTPPFNEIAVTDVTSCNGVGAADGIIDATGVNMAAVNTDEFEAIQNGSFEVPDILTEFGSSTFKIFDQSLADGWSSTDLVLEYWKSGFQGVPALEGNQFAEINANNPGTFYFDVVTKPGVRMNWSFGHRGRQGTDVVALKIDDPAAVTPIEIGQFSTGTADWVRYSGEYTIPDGQTISRFSFEAISTAGGSLSVGNFMDDVVFEVAPYYFQLFAGTNSSGSPLAENTTGYFDTLPEGTYTLSIVNNITGCPTDDIPIIINLQEQEPVLVRQTKTADTYCVNGNGTQRITASTAIGDPTAGYKYEIYTGTDTTVAPYAGPFIDADGDYTFTDLEDNTYRVLVINRDNACTAFTDVTILDNSEIPSFSNAIINNNTSCDPAAANGQIIANVFGQPKTDYTWSWLDDGGLPITGKTAVDAAVDGNANNLTDLAAGTYQVYAIHTETGCETGFLPVVIIDDPSGNFPTISISEVTTNTSCGVGNGSLTASVDEGGGPGVTTGYTFEWFVGADDSGAVLTVGDNAGNNSDVNFTGTESNTITGLSAPVGNNTYTVRVTNSDNCSNTATLSLSSNPTTPVIDDTDPGDVNLTQVTTCLGSAAFPEGEIELTDVADGAFTNAATDFTYSWYIGNSNTGTVIANGADIGTQKGATATAINVSGATTNHIVGLDAGDYTVEATNIATGCLSAAVVVTVTESLETITMGETPVSDQVNCSGDPSGSSTITASDPGGHTFTYEFFV
ncbi:MAG: hypothetical protein ABJF65_20265, partial [Reichenbachiella sp.]